MDEYDDDEPAFPVTITIAGWMWVAIGLFAVGFMVWIIVTYWSAQLPARGRLFFGPLFLLPVGILGLVGVKTLRRRLNEPIEPGIFSVGYGGLHLMMVWDVPWRNIELHILFGMPGMLLITAGLLALVGRGAYLRWREATRRAADAEG